MINLSNKRFGQLTVLHDAGKDKRGEYKWLCRCDCGNETIVYGSHLRRGDTVSCGCVMRTSNRTHGESKTRLYKIWQHMKGRCDNCNSDNYKYYGGRGVTYCEEWKTYKPFKEWALKNGYKEDLSIDRIDFNGNYTPDNCRWITMEEQHKNCRKCILLTHNGETHTLRDWAKQLGINPNTLSDRYRKGVNIFE